MCSVASLTIAKIYDIFKELEFITQKCVRVDVHAGKVQEVLKVSLSFKFEYNACSLERKFAIQKNKQEIAHNSPTIHSHLLTFWCLLFSMCITL